MVGSSTAIKSLNKGRTALQIAAEQGFLELVELLLEKGASVWVRDDNGGLSGFV